MKVIARGKKDGWYIVSVTGYPKKLRNPIYIGNGKQGVITSFANISKRYWSEDELEDLRNTNTPVPEEVKTHIEKLFTEAKRKQA